MSNLTLSTTPVDILGRPSCEELHGHVSVTLHSFTVKHT